MPITPTASVAVVTPQSLATDGKVVWLLTSTGSVQRIDPATDLVQPQHLAIELQRRIQIAHAQHGVQKSHRDLVRVRFRLVLGRLAFGRPSAAR